MDTKRQRLINAARRWLPSRADAEDAVQDTYVRALASMPKILEPHAGWLHTVLRNIAIDRLRRGQLESQHSQADSPPDASLDSLMESRSECEGALRHLLERVRPDEAAAILLSDVFEFDCHEIARFIGKNDAACRQFLHRARTRARRVSVMADVEELYVGLCWRAIETREPALLMDMLQVVTARAQQATISVPQHRGARSFSKLVQVNGRFALALVLDGVVLCLVPVGTSAMPMTESV